MSEMNENIQKIDKYINLTERAISLTGPMFCSEFFTGNCEKNPIRFFQNLCNVSMVKMPPILSKEQHP